MYSAKEEVFNYQTTHSYTNEVLFVEAVLLIVDDIVEAVVELTVYNEGMDYLAQGDHGVTIDEVIDEWIVQQDTMCGDGGVWG